MMICLHIKGTCFLIIQQSYQYIIGVLWKKQVPPWPQKLDHFSIRNVCGFFLNELPLSNPAQHLNGIQIRALTRQSTISSCLSHFLLDLVVFQIIIVLKDPFLVRLQPFSSNTFYYDAEFIVARSSYLLFMHP